MNLIQSYFFLVETKVGLIPVQSHPMTLIELNIYCFLIIPFEGVKLDEVTVDRSDARKEEHEDEEMRQLKQ